LVPQWNLGLVLAALNSPPFEPAEEVDLRFLYYKCCFLLALASGRRRSEIMSEIPFFKGRKSLVLLAGREFLVLSRYMLRILIGQDNLEEASSGKAGIMTGSAPLSGI
jgi:hypothetical protein